MNLLQLISAWLCRKNRAKYPNGDSDNAANKSNAYKPPKHSPIPVMSPLDVDSEEKLHDTAFIMDAEWWYAFLQHICPDLCTGRFWSFWDNMGTLDNEKVYVTTSSIAETLMLGLYAGVDFKAGDVVTEYGGSLRSADSLRNKDERSHARNIPGSGCVRDGRHWSRFFSRGLVDLLQSVRSKAGERKRFLPTGTHANCGYSALVLTLCVLRAQEKVQD